MIEKIVKIRRLQDDEVRANLEYWLNRAPEERIEAVDLLRRQHMEVIYNEQGERGE